jgi:hypothetical protein
LLTPSIYSCVHKGHDLLSTTRKGSGWHEHREGQTRNPRATEVGYGSPPKWEGAQKMMKEMAKGTKRIARGTALTLGVAVMVALVLGVATTALAGTGVGARFQLGKTNTVNAVSRLVGSVVGPSLVIDNDSADATATALDLQVQPGKAPMKVNSSAKVTNLNVDKIDGLDSSSFASYGESAYSYSKVLTTCNNQDQELVSIPFSIGRPSLVYASANAVYSANTSTQGQGIIEVRLRNAANTTTLASGGRADSYVGTESSGQLSVQGVLRGGSNPYDPSATPFVAAPGDYTLQLLGDSSAGPCDAGSPLMRQIALSYLLIGQK